MAMFIHKSLSGTLCTTVPFPNLNNGWRRWKSCTNVMNYITSLVVYIYCKCTIWLQYKDSFKLIPLGTHTWQQIRDDCETILSRTKLLVNLLTLWVPSMICNKSAKPASIIFFEHSLDKTRTSLPSNIWNKAKVENKCLLGRNTSHSTDRVSAQQFYCSTMMSEGQQAPGFSSLFFFLERLSPFIPLFF